MSKKTVQQWLDLPEDERALELAKVFTPGQPGKHNLIKAGKNNIEHVRKTGATYQSEWKCSRCKAFFPIGVDDGRYGDCSVPDRIKIDWNTAMKWYRPHSKLWTYIQCLENVWRFLSHGDFTFWQEHEAQPKHYLIAAAMAMESKEE
ncbi:hypothetical protein LCGC14_1606820 [marine sediment metagenome]|uniref:Uncharacterized protein n=1 Tax=marine sediment metagenome TaxID=412755 RepID=A0A0F9KQB5_9ZZZZ